MKHSTSDTHPQQPLTVSIGFCETPNENLCRHLVATKADMPATEALEVAADLSSGLMQILDKFAVAVNDGELVYVDELRALSFLAETANALILAAHRVGGVNRASAGGEQ